MLTAITKVLLLIFIPLSVLAGCKDISPPIVKLDNNLDPFYQLIRDSQFGSARVRLRQYMEVNGESSQSLFMMGFSYHQQKRYAKAVEWFTLACNTKTSFYPATWHFLGWSYYYLGQIDSAKESFHRFLMHLPHEPDSLFALGLIATELGEDIEAEMLYRKAIKFSSGGEDSQKWAPRIAAKANARLGDLYALQGELTVALELYDNALELNPELYEVWHRKSLIFQRRGDDLKSTQSRQQFFQIRNIVRPDLMQTSFPE